MGPQDEPSGRPSALQLGADQREGSRNAQGVNYASRDGSRQVERSGRFSHIPPAGG